jgi:hypothetical protein
MKYTALPLNSLPAWARLNDVHLSDVSIETQIIGSSSNGKGGGLVSTAKHTAAQPLIAVPLDMVLSKERVEQCAKADKDLQQLIEATSNLFQVGQQQST